VLYQFGTGPIRGFAVTLGIGLISSMYTALIVTRLIFDRTYGRGA
jgi:preprotein translocase subunit SecD